MSSYQQWHYPLVVNVNAKTAIANSVVVQMMNPDKINETKMCSADDEKQSEKRTQ